MRDTYDVTVNGKSLSSLGFYIPSRTDVPAPKKIYRTYKVLDRDGELYEDTGNYEDLEINIEVNYASVRESAWNDRFRALKALLDEASVMAFSDDRNHFYKVKHAEIDEMKRQGRRVAQLSIKFICDPYAYRHTGNVYMNRRYDTNPGRKCWPDYKITGSGTVTLKVNGVSFNVQMLTKSVTISSSAQNAVFSNGNYANSYVSGDYSKLFLKPGKNTVSISSGGTLSVKPNWRDL